MEENKSSISLSQAVEPIKTAILHKELPGLRGFSTSNLYEIRKFYEAWKMLDTDIPVVTGKCINTADNILKPTDIKNNSNFPVVTGKFSSQEISITLPDMDDLKQLLENDIDYKIVKE
ncbi:MAG: hypothetical protein J6T63_07750 [Bacteroidales bacterium]|nr:hypothetical protein [Bacteroidales bacterium]